MLKLPPMPLCQEIRKIGIRKILPLFPVTLMVVRSAKKKLPMLSVNHWEKSCLRHHYRHQIGQYTSSNRGFEFEFESEFEFEFESEFKSKIQIRLKLSFTFSSSPSTTVIIINGSSNEATTSSTSTSNKPNSNHRSVTKPRDVKNKSNRTKMILRMNTSSSSLLSTSSSSSPPNSKSPSPPIVITDKLIQQSGSVYCSLFGGDLSEEDIQNHHKKQIHHSSYA